MVKRLTLDLGSGHDLKVHEMELRVGLCAEWSLLGILSLSISATPRSLSLSKHK